MKKITFKPGTMVYPVPAVMVSCGSTADSYNIITIAWTGIINSEPPMTYISVRKSRYSHGIIMRDREFVINLGTEKLAMQLDFCGVRSGRELDKFKSQGLTPIPATTVNCPMIQESPVNVECKVTQVLEFHSHDMFIAEIVAVSASEDLMNKNGKLELEKAGLLCYSHGEYFGLSKAVGKFGFSVMKAKTKKRLKKISK